MLPTRRWIPVLFLCSACTAAPPRSAGSAPGSAPGAASLAPAEALARDLELARAVHQPAAGHRELNGFVGRWDVEVQGRERASAAFEPVARGRATIDWILGGRFLDWRLALDVRGERHDVRGYLGHDVTQDQVQALWLSDLTTQMALARGEGTPTGRGIVFHAGDASGGRNVMRLLDGGTFVIETVGSGSDGDEGVLRRTLYTRRAGD